MDDPTRQLGEACATNNVPKAFCALMNGADPVSDVFDRPPIVVAAAAGHKLIVKLLLFADHPFGPTRATPASVLGDALVAACSYGAGKAARASIAELLLRRGAPPDSQGGAEGGTALYYAVSTRNVDAILILLVYGADASLPCRGPRAATPMILAVTSMYMEEVYMLLANGADANIQTPWVSVLTAAVSTGNSGLVQICVEVCGANVNAILTATGRTALHHAAVIGSDDIMQQLLNARADPDAVHDRNGDTPLTLAAAAGHAGVITVLGRAGANANLPRRHDGATPLEIALMYDSTACLRPLLELGADPYATSRWPSGRTVYELAVARANIDTVAMLYDAMSVPPQHGAHVRTTDEAPTGHDDCHAFSLHDVGPSAGLSAKPRIYVPSNHLKSRTPPPTWRGAAAPTDSECIVCCTRRPIPDAAERAMWCSRAHNAFAPCGHGALLCGMCCAVLATCPYCRADAFATDGCSH